MKQKENYLDYIPICNPWFSWKVDKKGSVVVEIKNKGVYNRIAQKFWGRPKKSYIYLDDYGSFVWQQMDGKRTIYDISGLVKGEYGDEIEPLFEWLSQYFKLLYKNHFIGYVK